MALTYNKVIELLKEKNYRLTDIRLAIIKVLVEKKHLTLAEIVEELEIKFDSVNLMSVYNTLDLLLREHILFTNTFDGKQIWYDMSENPSVHAICDSCKEVIHITDSNIIKTIDLSSLSKAMGKMEWQPIHFKIEGHGICDKCKNLDNNHTHFDDDLDKI